MANRSDKRTDKTTIHTYNQPERFEEHWDEKPGMFERWQSFAKWWFIGVAIFSVIFSWVVVAKYW